MKGRNAAQLYRERRVARGIAAPPHIWRKAAVAATAAIPIGAIINWESKLNVAMADEAGLVDADKVPSVLPKGVSKNQAPGNADNNFEVVFNGRVAVNKEMANVMRRAVALCRRGKPLGTRDLACLMSQYYGSLPGFEDLQAELPPEQKPHFHLQMNGLSSSPEDIQPVELTKGNASASAVPEEREETEEAEVPVRGDQGMSDAATGVAEE